MQWECHFKTIQKKTIPFCACHFKEKNLLGVTCYLGCTLTGVDRIILKISEQVKYDCRVKILQKLGWKLKERQRCQYWRKLKKSSNFLSWMVVAFREKLWAVHSLCNTAVPGYITAFSHENLIFHRLNSSRVDVIQENNNWLSIEDLHN